MQNEEYSYYKDTLIISCDEENQSGYMKNLKSDGILGLGPITNSINYLIKFKASTIPMNMIDSINNYKKT